MNNKEVTELIEDMAEGYATNFRGGTFFNDWTKEECKEVSNKADRHSKYYEGTTLGAVWAMVSLLASYLVLEYEKLEKELE